MNVICFKKLINTVFGILLFICASAANVYALGIKSAATKGKLEVRELAVATVTTIFNTTLDNTHTFKRPQSSAGLTSQLLPADCSESNNNYSYFEQIIKPQVTGNYAIEATTASLSNGSKNTFVLLYAAGFNPSAPLNGLIAANDDSESSELSKINTVALQAGVSYILVASTHSPGITGTASLTITGPGSVAGISSTPTLATTGLLNNFTAPAGIASTAQSFTVSGVNLNSAVTVTPPAGFQVAETLAGPYVSSALSVTPTNGTLSSTTVYVRMASLNQNPAAGYVMVTATGAASRAVPVSGTLTAPLSADAKLLKLELSAGILSPAFTPANLNYSISVDNAINIIKLTPTKNNAYATLAVNGTTVESGTASAAIGLNVGANTITTQVTAQNGTTKTYTVTITRAIAAQTITFTELSAKTYGDTDFDAGATSTNATIPITYSSDNEAVASVVNGKIHVVGAGVAHITVSQAGNANYSAAVPVTRQLVVKKAAISIAAISQNKTYGEADPALVYEITLGALVGDDAFTGGLIREPGENAGVYAIKQGTLSLSANYSLTYTGTNFNVNKKQITVTATAQRKTYGEADPALTYSYTSSSLVGQDAFTGLLSREAGENAGSYAIQQGALALNGNYEINFRGDSLHIGKKNLLIAANNQQKTYGQPNPEFTVTYSGFSGNDTEASLTAKPLINTIAATTSGAGIYDILVSGAASVNYQIAYQKGALAVQKAQLEVIADNKIKAYRDNNPAFTVSYNGFVNGDTEASLITLPVAATSATATANVGTYDIVTSGGAAANYELTYRAGNLVVVPAGRNISFTKTLQATYDDADFAAGAKASTGEAVIYSSDNARVAIIVNGKVHITGAGTANITASLPANANFADAEPVTQILAVDKAKQYIRLASLPVLNRENEKVNLGEVLATSGLPVKLLVDDSSVAVLQNNTLTANRAGSTRLVAMQEGNENYYPATVAQSIIVNNVEAVTAIASAQSQAVSPNGDGINDFLYIDGVQDYPTNKVTVINNKGLKVSEISGYDNTAKVFDGHSSLNSQLQQAGTYYYVAEFGGKQKTGWFILKY